MAGRGQAQFTHDQGAISEASNNDLSPESTEAQKHRSTEVAQGSQFGYASLFLCFLLSLLLADDSGCIHKLRPLSLRISSLKSSSLIRILRFHGVYRRGLFSFLVSLLSFVYFLFDHSFFCRKPSHLKFQLGFRASAK
ncbi:hypothetical protein F5Y11DRAFT_131719 [Daldinia sp. FL1419]|nr:hypothetical protein F5Y11DRAFT_131719 [Daldinia sp. FL1419]